MTCVPRSRIVFAPFAEQQPTTRVREDARRTGRTKSYYARELIEENLEDLEDRYIAEARLEKRRTPLTSNQVRRELGLDR